MTGRATMETAWTAEPFVPASRSLRTLQRAVQDCRGCPLYADATRAVFGEGSRTAPIVLVGEQPGDQEDRQGHPFVGPAGGVLWRCLDDAGIERDEVFVTNAVKHFKTYHPSAVLRADDAAAVIRAALVEDLRRARRLALADA